MEVGHSIYVLGVFFACVNCQESYSGPFRSEISVPDSENPRLMDRSELPVPNGLEEESNERSALIRESPFFGRNGGNRAEPAPPHTRTMPRHRKPIVIRTWKIPSRINLPHENRVRRLHERQLPLNPFQIGSADLPEPLPIDLPLSPPHIIMQRSDHNHQHDTNGRCSEDEQNACHPQCTSGGDEASECARRQHDPAPYPIPFPVPAYGQPYWPNMPVMMMPPSKPPMKMWPPVPVSGRFLKPEVNNKESAKATLAALPPSAPTFAERLIENRPPPPPFVNENRPVSPCEYQPSPPQSPPPPPPSPPPPPVAAAAAAAQTPNVFIANSIPDPKSRNNFHVHFRNLKPQLVPHRTQCSSNICGGNGDGSDYRRLLRLLQAALEVNGDCCRLRSQCKRDATESVTDESQATNHTFSLTPPEAVAENVIDGKPETPELENQTTIMPPSLANVTDVPEVDLLAEFDQSDRGANYSDDRLWSQVSGFEGQGKSNWGHSV